jgi:SAM-dependent methyltransferase
MGIAGGGALSVQAHAVPLPDASQDYVISSHVIEHLPDPIGAFIEWTRLLKPGGTVFMIVPHRDAHPPDKSRPVSTVDELVEAYANCYTPDTHPYQDQGRRGHYWVFTLESMKALVTACNDTFALGWTLVYEEAIDAKVGNGFTLVYRYEPQSAPQDAEDWPEAAPVEGDPSVYVVEPDNAFGFDEAATPAPKKPRRARTKQ